MWDNVLGCSAAHAFAACLDDFKTNERVSKEYMCNMCLHSGFELNYGVFFFSESMKTFNLKIFMYIFW